jgi:Tfp pilus assembly protein PilO
LKDSKLKIQSAYSRKLLVLLALCLLAGFVYLINDYSRQQREQNSISTQIEECSQVFQALDTPPDDLQLQLENTRKANEEVKTRLSISSSGSTTIIASILKAADECNLKTTPLGTDIWTEQNVGDSIYQLLPINLDIRGKTADIIRFISRIEDRQAFPDLVVTNFVMKNNDATDTSNGEIIAADEAEASVTLDIVTRIKIADEEIPAWE